MRCDDLADLISAYADGQTLPAQTEFVEAHLVFCSRCRATLQRHRQTTRLLRLADPADEWRVPDLRLRLAHATAALEGAGPRRAAVIRSLSGSLVAALALCWAIAGTSGAGRTQQVAQGTPPALVATLCGNCAAYLRFGPHLAGRPPHGFADAQASVPPAQRDEAPPAPRLVGRGKARAAMRPIPM